MRESTRRTRCARGDLEVIRGTKPRSEWEDPPPLAIEDELDPNDLYATPIPAGEYTAGFVDQKRVDGLFKNGTTKWLVVFRIVGGPHEGRHLLYAVRVLPEKKRPRPSFKFTQLFAAVSQGRRPPKDLWRRSPRNLLKGAVVRVRVSTVTMDAAGKPKPENLWYSKVDAVLELIAGTPPAFRMLPK